MGYSCKPKGNNIPDTIWKKRRVDGIRWPLRAGDNLSFLDHLSWPLFFDDYAHLTADIIWASLNDDENHADFHRIGNPDLTGMVTDEDVYEQEEEQSLMLKPAKLSNQVGLFEKNSYIIDRSTRRSRSKILYAAGDADDESFKADPTDDANVDGDEDFMAPLRPKALNRRTRVMREDAAQKTTHAVNSLMKLPTIDKSLLHTTKNARPSITIPTSLSEEKNAPKKRKYSMPMNNMGYSASKSPRRLPLHGKQGSSQPQPKNENCASSFARGSKVDWVEQAPQNPLKRSLKDGKVEYVESPLLAVKSNATSGCSSTAASTSPSTPNTQPCLFKRGEDWATAGSTEMASLHAFERDAVEMQNDTQTYVPPGGVLSQHSQFAHSALARAQPHPQMQSAVVFCNSVSSATEESLVNSARLGISDMTFGSSNEERTNAGSLAEGRAEVTGVLVDFIAGKLSKASHQSKIPACNFSASRVTNVSQGSDDSKKGPPVESSTAGVCNAKLALVPEGDNFGFSAMPLNIMNASALNDELESKMLSLAPAQTRGSVKSSTRVDTLEMLNEGEHTPDTSTKTGSQGDRAIGVESGYATESLTLCDEKLKLEVIQDGNKVNAVKPIAEEIGCVQRDEGINFPVEPAVRERGAEAGDSGQLEKQLLEDHVATDDQSTESDDWDDREQWFHFLPVKSMRAGVPYHRLSLEEKLLVLEFLIDEVLTLGIFSAEFARRCESNTSSTTYGSLPTQFEFDNLENDDDCAVCRGEGELLCCDGCSSSYHRVCIGMKPNEALPHGLWLCPECELVDPAKYGSLRGGRKCSLDWFTLVDIKNAVRCGKECDITGESRHLEGYNVSDERIRLEEESRLSSIPNGSPAPETVGTMVKSLPGGAIVRSTSNVSNLELYFKDQGAGCLSSRGRFEATQVVTTSINAAHSVVNPVSSDRTTSPALRSETVLSNGSAAVETQRNASVNESEYLIVHGFVFQRVRHAVLPPGNRHSNSMELLSKQKLTIFLKSLGPELASSWPLAQIPFQSLESSVPIGERSTTHPNAISFQGRETFDPSFYVSKYRKTPLSMLSIPGAGFQSMQLIHSDYERTCNSINLKRLNDKLSADMAADKTIFRSLLLEAQLFDPHQPMRDYMLKLENVLNRTHLLSELWGTRNTEMKVNCWQTNVRDCRSIPRLASLLLQLVDATESRVFADSWFLVAGSKDAEQHPFVKGISASFLPLVSSDWTPEAESRKRKWERTPLTNIRYLLAKEGRNIEALLYGDNKTLIRRKRKQSVVGRFPLSPEKLSSAPKETDSLYLSHIISSDPAGLSESAKRKKAATVSLQDLQHAINKRVSSGIPSEKQDVGESENHPGDGKDGKSVKASNRARRSGRIQTKKESPEEFLAHVIADSGMSPKMEILVEAQKMAKLLELKEFTTIPFIRTTIWPVAGRLLFDPLGEISKHEMRRLGRKAGSVVAQDVSYSGSYEVGEVAHFHVWRKNVRTCICFEQLLHLIRALESNLDRHVSKTLLQNKVILVVQQDLLPDTFECCLFRRLSAPARRWRGVHPLPDVKYRRLSGALNGIFQLVHFTISFSKSTGIGVAGCRRCRQNCPVTWPTVLTGESSASTLFMGNCGKPEKRGELLKRLRELEKLLLRLK